MLQILRVFLEYLYYLHMYINSKIGISDNEIEYSTLGGIWGYSFLMIISFIFLEAKTINNINILFWERTRYSL